MNIPPDKSQFIQNQEPGQDRIYATPRDAVEPFRFDETVARVFPDMIRRSVPGYATMVEVTGVIAGRYAQPGSNLYDLGCSLGAVTLAMRHQVSQIADCRIIAIDNAPAMIAGAQRLLDANHDSMPVTLRCENILDTRFQQASVVALNFTLQFILREERTTLLSHIADGMLPGGALVLSEKIRCDNAAEQQLNDALHHAFKRSEGYSDMEIAQKRSALEQVLVPDTLDEHIERLTAAGFTDIAPWFRCCNFVSLIARKTT